jgi:hypothetical protein
MLVAAPSAARRAEAIAPRCAPAARATVLGPGSESKGEGQDGGRDATRLSVLLRVGERRETRRGQGRGRVQG